MKEILKLIENIDHKNRSRMFQLNENVYEWLLTIDPNTPYGLFVFSRDALKIIRPEGWALEMMSNHFCLRMEKVIDGKEKSVLGWRCQFDPPETINGPNLCMSPILETEELAELHAILQAITYERENA